MKRFVLKEDMIYDEDFNQNIYLLISYDRPGEGSLSPLEDYLWDIVQSEVREHTNNNLPEQYHFPMIFKTQINAD